MIHNSRCKEVLRRKGFKDKSLRFQGRRNARNRVINIVGNVYEGAFPGGDTNRNIFGAVASVGERDESVAVVLAAVKGCGHSFTNAPSRRASQAAVGRNDIPQRTCQSRSEEHTS